MIWHLFLLPLPLLTVSQVLTPTPRDGDPLHDPSLPKPSIQQIATAGGVQVSLTGGEVMYYTTDGTPPWDATSVGRQLYVGPFLLDRQVVLRVVVISQSGRSGDESVARVTPTPQPPNLSPSGGSFVVVARVTCGVPSGAWCFFVTFPSGTTPPSATAVRDQGTRYSSPVTIFAAQGPQQVAAVTVWNNEVSSLTVSQSYEVSHGVVRPPALDALKAKLLSNVSGVTVTPQVPEGLNLVVALTSSDIAFSPPNISMSGGESVSQPFTALPREAGTAVVAVRLSGSAAQGYAPPNVIRVAVQGDKPDEAVFTFKSSRKVSELSPREVEELVAQHLVVPTAVVRVLGVVDEQYLDPSSNQGGSSVVVAVPSTATELFQQLVTSEGSLLRSQLGVSDEKVTTERVITRAGSSDDDSGGLPTHIVVLLVILGVVVLLLSCCLVCRSATGRRQVDEDDKQTQTEPLALPDEQPQRTPSSTSSTRSPQPDPASPSVGEQRHITSLPFISPQPPQKAADYSAYSYAEGGGPFAAINVTNPVDFTFPRRGAVPNEPGA